MAIKPTKPTTPLKALRSDPSTFPARAEGTVDFLFGTNLDYVADSNTFVDERADAALAAALGGDLPAITGQSLKLLRVNAGETAAEFASAADVTAAIKASTANAEAGTGDGLMDAALTKAAIDAQTLGTDQTPQNVTGSRALSTSYQNTTGKPIFVAIMAENTNNSTNLQISVDNLTWVTFGRTSGNAGLSLYAVVADGHYYRLQGTNDFIVWAELR